MFCRSTRFFLFVGTNFFRFVEDCFFELIVKFAIFRRSSLLLIQPFSAFLMLHITVIGYSYTLSQVRHPPSRVAYSNLRQPFLQIHFYAATPAVYYGQF